MFCLLLGIGCLIQSCDRKEDPTGPILGSNKVIDIKETVATFIFYVESDGGNELLESGVCYGKNSNPTLKDSVKVYDHFIPQEYGDVYEGGENIMIVHNLEDGVKYYARAFAKNEVGIAYSEQKEFTTIASKLPKLSAELLSFDSRTATCKVNVSYDGGYDITERGVLIGDSRKCDLDNFIYKKLSGKGKGEFSITIEDLRWEEEYYLKAYATNENGTTYTENIKFTTPTIYGSFTDDRDGNVYRTLKIGSQIWMVDNLKYLPQVYPMKEGNPLKAYVYVSFYKGTDIVEAKKTSSYKNGYVYYNLVAAQLSCPEGWHLPTDEEWIQFELEMGMNKEEVGAVSVRKTLDASKLISNDGYAIGGTNESGFNVYGVGRRTLSINDDDNYNIWQTGFWTNTETETGKVWTRVFGGKYEEAYVLKASYKKEYGLCVRCVKDE